MLRALRNSKGSTELSAKSMWIAFSGDNHNISNLVFSLYVRVLAQGTCYSKVTTSLLPPAHTSCWGNHNQKACHIAS